MSTTATATDRRSIRVVSRRMKFLIRLARFGWRYLAGYLARGRFQAAKAPPELHIETTNVCNADCVFCANSLMQRRRQPLAMDLFQKAVDDYAAMGGGTIDFNAIIGEPLLDPHLLERVRFVRDNHPRFTSRGFVTTLQWLHRFDLNEFFDSGITWLSLSITLSGRDKYREFFRVDKYDQMLANLLALLGENNRRGNPISLIFSIKPTDEPIEAVVGHPDFARVNALLPKHDLVRWVNDQGYYVDDWLGTVELPEYLRKRPYYPRAFRPCRLLYEGLVVYSSGNVGACSCRDFEGTSELVLGNVAKDDLADLWKGEKLAEIRSNWLRRNKIPDICRSCRHYVY